MIIDYIYIVSASISPRFQCLRRVLLRPDCPCCVADTLGVVCVTTDDDGDQKSAMRNVGEAAVAVLMLACAVMVAICILAICLKSTTKQVWFMNSAAAV